MTILPLLSPNLEIVQRKQQCLKAHGALLDESHSVISRHQGARLTYGALDKKSKAFAQGLLALGVKKGDRVAIMLGNNIEYAIVCGLEVQSRSQCLLNRRLLTVYSNSGQYSCVSSIVLDLGSWISK